MRCRRNGYFYVLIVIDRVQMFDDYNVNIVLSVTLVLFCTSFVFGWNQGVLNQPMVFIQKFFRTSIITRNEAKDITDGQVTALWATVNAIYVVGLFVGSIAGGALGYKFGRVRSMLISQVCVNRRANKLFIDFIAIYRFAFAVYALYTVKEIPLCISQSLYTLYLHT